MFPIRITVKREILPFKPRRSVAITLFPFIFTHEDWRDDEALFAHEMYHWDEMLRWGVIPWYIRYLWLARKYGGGRAHPMEKPAYAIQDRINKEKTG